MPQLLATERERSVVNSCRAKRKQCRGYFARALVKAESCLNLTSDSTDEIASARLLFTPRLEVHYVRGRGVGIGCRCSSGSYLEFEPCAPVGSGGVQPVSPFADFSGMSRPPGAPRATDCRADLALTSASEVVPVEYSPGKRSCRRARGTRGSYPSEFRLARDGAREFSRFHSALVRVRAEESLVSDRSRLFRDTRATSRDMEIFRELRRGRPRLKSTLRLASASL